eukprot:NODE_4_length_77007_cov_1.156642.p44 type:complete len:255 gc:universal NODE_4_length_77007_cov_1.156642:38435-39199(+)
MTLEAFGFKRVAIEDREAKRTKLESDNQENDLVETFIPTSWKLVLQKEFRKDYFLKLEKLVDEDRKKFEVYPPPEKVFASLAVKFEDVKVVILGQDPYHGPNQAMGLSFSVQKEISIPPSLRNIYLELKSDLGIEIAKHGDLTAWSKEGVLLLNASLTVRKNSPNSHKDFGWYKFTDVIIKEINSKRENVVFMLWGSFAQQKAKMIDSKRHLVLKSPHPSPFSAHKGFLGNKHFSKANDYLKAKSKEPVNWKIE